MRIADAPQPGGPEALVIREVAVPDLPPGHVLIRVAAAGLNRADLLQRRGVYPPPADAPSHPGLEVSGTVAAIAPGVEEFRIGDEVCALLQGGGYSEYCAAPVGQTLPRPNAVSLVDAAALPEATFTVWSNVFDSGRLSAGETLLVHGGTSGIGVIAIQVARALDHRVIATAGSQDKCRVCVGLGADPAINYHDEDFVAAVRATTADRGVDVILDIVAGDYVPRNLEALEKGGRLVVIATQGGTRSTLDMRIMMKQRLTLMASLLRPEPVAFKQSLKAAVLKHVWPLLEAGSVRPIVDRVFALEDAAAAHAYMERGTHIGKVLLVVDAGANRAGA